VDARETSTAASTQSRIPPSYSGCGLASGTKRRPGTGEGVPQGAASSARNAGCGRTTPNPTGFALSPAALATWRVVLDGMSAQGYGGPAASEAENGQAPRSGLPTTGSCAMRRLVLDGGGHEGRRESPREEIAGAMSPGGLRRRRRRPGSPTSDEGRDFRLAHPAPPQARAPTEHACTYPPAKAVKAVTGKSGPCAGKMDTRPAARRPLRKSTRRQGLVRLRTARRVQLAPSPTSIHVAPVGSGCGVNTAALH